MHTQQIAELLEVEPPDTAMSDESFGSHGHHQSNEEEEEDGSEEGLDSEDEITDDEEELLTEDGYNSAGEEVRGRNGCG